MGRCEGYRPPILKNVTMDWERRKEDFETDFEIKSRIGRSPIVGLWNYIREEIQFVYSWAKIEGMEDQKITMVKKSEDRLTSSKYKDRRCIWCDSTEHVLKNCDEHKEALKWDLIYYEANKIHSMDSQKL